MNGLCLLASTACWPVDAPAASTVWLVTAVFVVCVTCVIGSALPGRAAVRLGRREGRFDRALLPRGALYALWIASNLAIAAGLWTQLFPRAPPVKIIYSAHDSAPTLDCMSPTILNLGCVLSASMPDATGDAEDLGDAARLLIDRIRHPTRGTVPTDAPPASVDVAAYAALLTLPVSELVIAGTEGTDPRHAEELAATGWPWVARWVDRFEARGGDVVSEVQHVATTRELDTCIGAKRQTTLDPLALLIRFCLLPPASGAIEAVIDVRLDGPDVLVEVQGRALPPTAFASIDDLAAEGTLTAVPGSDRAMLRLTGLAERARAGRLLRVGVAANALTQSRSLGFSTVRAWCLVAEGNDRIGLAAARDSVLPRFSETRRQSLTSLSVESNPCPHGTVYLATNGIVLAGTDLSPGRAQALATALSPDDPRPNAFRARVLDPLFDAAPGLLDDVRLGQRAMRHGALVISPLVVREVAFNGPLPPPPIGFSDPGPGFADFVKDRLVDPAVPLAAIVAWVEGGPEGTGPGRVLAGSFGRALWSEDPITQLGAWGALVSMREAIDIAAPTPLTESAYSLDALGVALTRVLSEDRQHRIFAALSGWLLLMFLMRWGAR